MNFVVQLFQVTDRRNSICDVVVGHYYTWNPSKCRFFFTSSYPSGQHTTPVMELPGSSGNDNLKFELEQMKKEIATEL